LFNIPAVPERQSPFQSDMDETISTERAYALNVNERVRLMRDGLVNNSASVVSAIVGIILVPIMLHGLKTEPYSLWIAALALRAMLAGFDLGLGYIVVREIAARNSETKEESSTFVQAAGNAYLYYGLLGGLVIGALGLPLSHGLHLSPSVQRVAPVVFALCGVCFFTEQQMSFVSATLQGLRRFDAVNLINATVVLLRAAGIVVLLKAGGELVALMAWYTLVAVGGLLLGLAMVGRIDGSLRFRLGGLRWRPLRGHMSFGLASQMVRIVIMAIWETGPLLVGLVLGSAWIVPFYIGEKFPRNISAANWQAAEVLFPSASRDKRAQDAARTREILELGTRWIVTLAVPICLVFWALGPGLLRAWVGEAQPDAVRVMRLMTAVIFADALGLASLYILWGYGRARTLVAVLGMVAASTVVLSLLLLKPVGVSAVPWAMLTSIAAGSVAFLYMASKMCGMGIYELVRNSFKGLFLPSLFSAAAAAGLSRAIHVNGWPMLVAASIVIGSAYCVSFYFSGARPEECELARQIAGLPILALRASFKMLRGLFHGSGSPGS
jgi:O-antigen/teichoic acid export membrane protein